MRRSLMARDAGFRPPLRGHRQTHCRHRRLNQQDHDGQLQVSFHAEHRERMREAIAQGSEAFLEEVERFAELEDRINNFEY